MLKYACEALWNLGLDNDDNRRRVAQAGSVEVVVKAMKQHPFNVRLLEHASALLQNLSTHTDEENRKECEERRSLIGKAGGVNAVTKAIQRHPSFTELVKVGCGTLRNLCVGNDDNRRRVAQAGGCRSGSEGHEGSSVQCAPLRTGMCCATYSIYAY